MTRQRLLQWRAGRAWLTNLILCALGAGLLHRSRRPACPFPGVGTWLEGARAQPLGELLEHHAAPPGRQQPQAPVDLAVFGGDQVYGVVVIELVAIQAIIGPARGPAEFLGEDRMAQPVHLTQFGGIPPPVRRGHNVNFHGP